MNKAIVWFRQDLRLEDNEAIVEATKNACQVIYVYVFDDIFFKDNDHSGFRRVGKFRLKFLLESVHNLRENLRAHGADLIIRTGRAQDEVFNLANELKTSWVFCNRERTKDELQIQDELEHNLWSIGQELRYSRGKMLYYTQDLPFPISQTPDSFSQFRKEVDKIIEVRHPLAKVKDFKNKANNIDVGDIPNLQSFGYDYFQVDKRTSFPFDGGETAGLKRLNDYVWKSKSILTCYETRNELFGIDFSSKLSPYLAQGCISPKTVYQEVRKIEIATRENQSTNWSITKLMLRDYYRLLGKKHLNSIFNKEGIIKKKITEIKNNEEIINQWIEARTSNPLVNALMNELNCTGYLSNRGRQLLASYFVHDLKQNWQIGARYFESMLLDYDVCSNWCNWNNVAGLGVDPKELKSSDSNTFIQKYDSKEEYIQLWGNKPLPKTKPG